MGTMAAGAATGALGGGGLDTGGGSIMPSSSSSATSGDATSGYSAGNITSGGITISAPLIGNKNSNAGGGVNVGSTTIIALAAVAGLALIFMMRK